MVEDIHVPLCTQCATYGHTRRFCSVRSDPARSVCTKCAEHHLTQECTVRFGDAAVCCAPCRGAGLEASGHPAGYHTCLVLLQRVTRLRAHTDYGAKTLHRALDGRLTSDTLGSASLLLRTQVSLDDMCTDTAERVAISAVAAAPPVTLIDDRPFTTEEVERALTLDLLDIPLPPGVSIQAYGDDTVLVVPGENRAAMERYAALALQRVAAWSPLSKVTISMAESFSLAFPHGSAAVRGPHLKAKSLKWGVITINPAETPQRIKSELELPQGAILAVRKFGYSTAAVVTFEGTKLPRFIFYHSVVAYVRPYKKTIPACFLCDTIGHRPSACPRPTPGRCTRCGTQVQVTPEGLAQHECNPTCLLCSGPHETGARGWPGKYRKPTPPSTSKPPANPSPGTQAASQPSPVSRLQTPANPPPTTSVHYPPLVMAPPQKMRQIRGPARITDWSAFRTTPFLLLSSPQDYQAWASYRKQERSCCGWVRRLHRILIFCSKSLLSAGILLLGMALPVCAAMSETRDVQDALPSGRHPPDGDRSLRLDGSSDSVFSADGDTILCGVELPVEGWGGGERDAPAGEIPTTDILPPADTIHSPPPSICATSVSTVQPGSDQVITAAMHRIADKQKQIIDLLFHSSCKIPNSQRSQIITWLSEIVQECSEVRAIAAHQSGCADELRDQLRLERRPASGVMPPGAVREGPRPSRTCAAAAHLGMQMLSTSTNLPPTAMAPGDVPRTDPYMAVPPPRDFAPRRDHAFIMFLTPIAPSAGPARDVAALLKHDIDLVAEGIGNISPRHTRLV
ncbi:hypothetical protein HPB49_004236 [Dermacentor silvarum]|uniref:Uncharacterized protein n=1 Tax=Dermacentor silvarum TaxID=543639 RepID=A0ACB8CPJ4_DERSI|nr:hypothetical protein HPB49_004236 [Dermacentor silvarum]